MALTQINSDGVKDDSIKNADIKSDAAIANSKLATDPLNASNLNSGTVPTARLGSGTAGNTNFLRGDGTWQVVENYNDDVVMSNIALLGFKTAVNGSLSKYSLVDQIIDEYTDGSGIDASASTNENLASGAYSGITGVGSAATGGTISDIGGDKLHTFTSNGTFTPPSAGTIAQALIVGGGGGGATYGGGGGGGSVIHVQNKPLTAQGYSIVVGAGGQGREIHDTDASDHEGDTSSAFGYSATGGGAGGVYQNVTATAGANGGGSGAYFANSANQQQGTAPSDIDSYDTVYGGYKGGIFVQSGNYPSGGGAGAGQNGGSPSSGSDNGGDGGNGVQINIDGNNHYWGGGGGGAVYNPDSGNGGDGGLGGGGGGADNGTGGASARNSGADGGGTTSGSTGGAGGANTGGGGGGTVYENNSGASNGAAGGSGIVMIRYTVASTFVSNTYNNMTLQSTATTAQAAPTKADLVILVEDTAGTATINTDVKGYISRNGSAFSSAVTFVDEGTWGTNKRIFAAHDVDISGITSGTSMKYKIETLNQAAGKQTKIHAASLGWR